MEHKNLKGTRRQASMYLSDVPQVEELRSRFNPLQAMLIPAHVTLCREDEVADWEELEVRIRQVIPIRLCLEFSAAIREGNLVYLPAMAGIEQFNELRRQLLSDGQSTPRRMSPHVTIIHARNGVCTDAIYAEICEKLPPLSVELNEVSLIEQIDGGAWRTFACVK